MSDPLHPYPSGQVPNLLNPPSLTTWAISVTVAAITLATGFCSLRLYARLKMQRQRASTLPWLKIEDCFVFQSWVSLNVYCALTIVTMSLKHGGTHVWDLSPAEIKQAAAWTKYTSIAYSPTILMTKLAILFFYLRVFIPQRWSRFYNTVWCLTITTTFYVALFIARLFPCVHIKCINTIFLLRISGVFNCVSNLIVILVPFKAVWDLNISLAKKRRIALVFAIAFVYVIMPSFTAKLITASPPKRADCYSVKTTENIHDVLYSLGVGLIYSIVEVTIGILYVCIPNFPVLFVPRHTDRPPSFPERRIQPTCTRRSEVDLLQEEDPTASPSYSIRPTTAAETTRSAASIPLDTISPA